MYGFFVRWDEKKADVVKRWALAEVQLLHPPPPLPPKREKKDNYIY